jgi:hypothetical protein
MNKTKQAMATFFSSKTNETNGTDSMLRIYWQKHHSGITKQQP